MKGGATWCHPCNLACRPYNSQQKSTQWYKLVRSVEQTIIYCTDDQIDFSQRHFMENWIDKNVFLQYNKHFIAFKDHVKLIKNTDKLTKMYLLKYSVYIYIFFKVLQSTAKHLKPFLLNKEFVISLI